MQLFLLPGCMQQICKNFFEKFLMSKTFQKAKNDQNLTNENESKQRLSLLKEKVFIQVV